LQTFPAPQLVPLVTFVHAVVIVVGAQVRHALAESTPGDWNTPPIQQPETQLAGLPLQTSPEGQVAFAPSRLVHWLALVPGWHVWHGLAGFTAPDA
jgi:hypothetical protein